ncbi:hypothetical protein ACWKWP_01335 [Agromyces soli]
MLVARAARPMRRVFSTLIAIAFGIVALRLLTVEALGGERGLFADGGLGGAMARRAPLDDSSAAAHAIGRGLVTHEPGFLVVALAVAAMLALLLLVSASEAGLSVVARYGLPGLDPRTRAYANGVVWATVVLLAVHFVGPAFEFVPGGHETAGVLLGGALGFGTARLHLRSIGHDGYRTFNLVSMLLAAGSLASMSITTTGQWWTLNFSTLGTSDDLAALCFNVGIVAAGVGMATLGPLLTRSLRDPVYGARRGGVTATRVLIAVIGLCLAGVGVVPIDTDTLLHNVFACGAAVGFAGLAGGVRGFARRMPKRLIVLSYAFLAVEALAMIAYDRLGLFSLTVFEIVAFTLVFAWLIALVVTTAGQGHDEGRVRLAATRHRVAPSRAERASRPRPGASAARRPGDSRIRSSIVRRIAAPDASADDPPDAAVLV